jgi:hypothetical protein
MPNFKGYKDKPESQYQPAKLSDRTREGQADGKQFGSGHEFNIKGKVTSMGNSYHDMTQKPENNFSDKNASMKYLQERNKKGQEVKNYSGLNYMRKHTGNGGGTSYNGNPIDETYTPATGNGEPSSNPVIRPKDKKSEEA